MKRFLLFLIFFVFFANIFAFQSLKIAVENFKEDSLNSKQLKYVFYLKQNLHKFYFNIIRKRQITNAAKIINLNFEDELNNFYNLSSYLDLDKIISLDFKETDPKNDEIILSIYDKEKDEIEYIEKFYLKKNAKESYLESYFFQIARKIAKIYPSKINILKVKNNKIIIDAGENLNLDFKENLNIYNTENQPFTKAKLVKIGQAFSLCEVENKAIVDTNDFIYLSKHKKEYTQNTYFMQSLFLPGLGQYNLKRKNTAYSIFTFSFLSLSSAAYFLFSSYDNYNKHQDCKDELSQLKNNGTINAEDIDNLLTKSNDYYDKYKNDIKKVNYSLLTFAAVYIYNLIDIYYYERKNSEKIFEIQYQILNSELILNTKINF